MTLRLYDTASRQLREFVPLQPGTASLYLCGATVQAPPHIGHVRSAVAFDVLSRWLTASGYRVVFCRNVTDIDDKILNVAAAAGVPWWEVAERNQRLFAAAYTAVGCVLPTVEPRATGHVPEMIVLMRRLIDSGHAYAVDGDVYFSVRSFPAYGALSGQDPRNLQQGESDVDNKRDPLDFALWKSAKPGEPAWETPWGSGRPGWHLECSAMATKYLGPAFDIHGGGLDLVFPHHENEQAQSRAAGDGFANFWVHNGLVTLGGDKMSKSLGNTLSVGQLARAGAAGRTSLLPRGAALPVERRLQCEYLDDAATAYRRIEGFVIRARELVGDQPTSVPGSTSSRRRSLTRWTTTSASRRHLRCCTTRCARAMPHSPTSTRRASHRLLQQVTAMLGVLGLEPAPEARRPTATCGP